MTQYIVPVYMHVILIYVRVLALIWWLYQHLAFYTVTETCVLKILLLRETATSMSSVWNTLKQSCFERAWGLLPHMQGKKELENWFSAYLQGVRKDDRKLRWQLFLGVRRQTLRALNSVTCTKWHWLTSWLRKKEQFQELLV